jgi:hypothetical protein
LSNPINDSNTPPVNPGARVQNNPAQGGISSPFAPANLPRSQHPALNGGNAGGAVVRPLTPQPDSARTNQRSR